MCVDLCNFYRLTFASCARLARLSHCNMRNIRGGRTGWTAYQTSASVECDEVPQCNKAFATHSCPVGAEFVLLGNEGRRACSSAQSAWPRASRSLAVRLQQLELCK